MSADEIKDKFGSGHDSAKEAFEELCAMVDALNVRTITKVNQFAVRELMLAIINSLSARRGGRPPPPASRP